MRAHPGSLLGALLLPTLAVGCSVGLAGPSEEATALCATLVDGDWDTLKTQADDGLYSEDTELAEIADSADYVAFQATRFNDYGQMVSDEQAAYNLEDAFESAWSSCEKVLPEEHPALDGQEYSTRLDELLSLQKTNQADPPPPPS